jgi:hypothetical protein
VVCVCVGGGGGGLSPVQRTVQRQSMACRSHGASATPCPHPPCRGDETEEITIAVHSDQTVADHLTLPQLSDRHLRHQRNTHTTCTACKTHITRPHHTTPHTNTPPLAIHPPPTPPADQEGRAHRQRRTRRRHRRRGPGCRARLGRRRRRRPRRLRGGAAAGGQPAGWPAGRDCDPTPGSQHQGGAGGGGSRDRRGGARGAAGVELCPALLDLPAWRLWGRVLPTAWVLWQGCVHRGAPPPPPPLLTPPSPPPPPCTGRADEQRGQRADGGARGPARAAPLHRPGRGPGPRGGAAGGRGSRLQRGGGDLPQVRAEWERAPWGVRVP